METNYISDFSWVNWNPDQIQKLAGDVLAEKKQTHKAIKAVSKEDRTFQNTLEALDRSSYELSDALCILDLHSNVSPKEEVRNAALKAREVIQNELIEIEYDEAMYQAVKEYAEKKEPLETDCKKLLDDTLRDYRRMGFELPLEKREELKKNLKELMVLENEFGVNINTYEDSIIVTPEEISGLPASYLERLKRDPQGNYIVTLDYPDYFPFMENADVAEKRKELAQKSLRKGGQKNIEILKRVLEIRKINSALLGYDTHASYVLEVRMAKTVEAVQNFIQDLLAKAQPGLVKEFDELRELKKQDTGESESQLAFYDRAYYYNKLKKTKFAVDPQLVKEYFPLETVKQGLFDLYGQLFSVTFERVSGLPVWHESVEWYQIKNKDGSPVSYFALDLYPRPNKYGHAAEFPLIVGRGIKNRTLPVCSLVCNFTAPTESLPSLLSHEEVETFFHEFGHVMHQNLSTTRFISQSGTNTSRDFVEAPSQMLESWVWDKDMLKNFSSHYKNPDQKIPDELAEKLISARYIDAANFVVGQVTQAQFDMLLHTGISNDDPAALHRNLVKENTGIALPDDAMFPAGFGHLMGYDAGYYGYMWSKVYAADMFTRFKAEGLLNEQTGSEYRKEILEKGSSRDELDSVKAFLGREPNSEAFFKDLGLV
jgi:thimet oligopeptidase